MKIKRKICGLMSLLMFFSFVSCGKTAVKSNENNAQPETVSEAPADDRTVIHAAYCEPSYLVTPKNPYSLKIAAFNRKNSEYRIEMESYTEENIISLSAEMLSGNSPDIIFGTLLDTDNESFCDLYEFLDSDDEISRDSFIPGIFQALEYKDELHKIWQYFGIYTATARESDVEGAERLLPEDYARIIADNPDRKYIVEPWINSETLLNWVGLIACASYINREDLSCNFTDPGFADLLSWCNSIGRNNEEFGDVSGETVLQIQTIQNLSRALSGISMGYGDEPYVYIGFPGENCPQSYFEIIEGCFSIPTGAKEKEGAWEFIKSQLLEKRKVNSGLDGFPVIEERFKAELEEASSPLPSEGEKKNEEKFVYLVYETNKAIDRTDETISKIIYEEGTKFLDGDKPLEDVIKTIQSRASVYLSEKDT